MRRRFLIFINSFISFVKILDNEYREININNIINKPIVLTYS